MKNPSTLYLHLIWFIITCANGSTFNTTYKTTLFAMKQRPYNNLVIELLERSTMLLCDHIIPYPDTSRIHYTESHKKLVDLLTQKNSTRILEMLNLNKAQTNINHNLLMVGPTTFNDLKDINKEFYDIIVLVKSKPVLILQKSKVLLLTKFLQAFQNCFTAIVFALLCATIVCTAIWVIEIHSVSKHFPDSPAVGILSSFWFTVVTMTTVGYGDKTPKHPLSRFITIVWIMFGLMLVALITASAWNSIDEDYDTEGITIGVIDRSVEVLMANKTLMGRPRAYDEYVDVMRAVKQGKVDAALMERYVAAAFFATGEYDDLLIEREFDRDITLRMFAHYKKSVVGCKENGLSMNSEEMEDEKEIITDFIGDPYKTEKYFLQPLSQIFAGQDNGLMIFMGYTGLVIVVLALVGEIIYRVKFYSSKDTQHGRNKHSLQEEAEYEMRFEEFRKQVERFVEVEVRYRMRRESQQTTIANNNVAHLSVD
eukprot:TCONS_00002486-protein